MEAQVLLAVLVAPYRVSVLRTLRSQYPEPELAINPHWAVLEAALPAWWHMFFLPNTVFTASPNLPALLVWPICQSE